MTTIKSGHMDTIEVDVRVGRGCDDAPREGEVWFDVILQSGDTAHANLPTADLLAALGVDPGWREKLAEAEKNLSALRANMQHARHEIANVEQDWRAAIDRAEKAEAERDFRRDENRELAAKLEAAEAKLARVREVLDQKLLVIPKGQSTIDALYNRLRAALADPEPFVLPTKPGVKFEARWNDGDPEAFTTFVGDEVLYKGQGGWNDAERFKNGAWHDFHLIEDGDA
jgi:hypothetical protein